MKKSTVKIAKQLFEDYPALMICKESFFSAFKLLVECYEGKGKVMVCGNGGSAADSEHIVGELMKGFMLKRSISSEHKNIISLAFPEDADYLSENLQRALPAISLVSQSALNFAFINDVSANMVFAQQVYGYGKEKDVLIALSSSGNSENIINAIKVAKAFKIKTIGLTGELGGQMKELCDVTIKVPSNETYKVQEYHLPIYHGLCAMIEMEMFGDCV